MFLTIALLSLACTTDKPDNPAGGDDTDAAVDETGGTDGGADGGTDGGTDGATPPDDTGPGGDSGEDTDPGTADGGADTEDTAPPEIDACLEVKGLAVVSMELSETPIDLARHLDVTLSGESALGVACARASDPDEIFYWETEPGLEHALDLFGFAPNSTYRCEVSPVCPRMFDAPESVEFTTGLPHPDIPRLTVTTHDALETEGPPWLVTNTGPSSGGGEDLIVIYDLEGTARWYMENTNTSYNDVVAQYRGDNVLVWGGGFSTRGATRMLNLMGEELYRNEFPNYESYTYTHEGRMLDDGRLLSFAWVDNSQGASSWTGFQIFVTEPGSGKLDYEYNSQYGVDEGLLATGRGDIYHGNWADIKTYKDGTERAYFSLCYEDMILAVDTATNTILWRFGPGGDFTLNNADGTRATDDEYPDCQHGPEVEGDRLLVYDNGASRSYSRATEYTLDEKTMTATLNWTWTEEGWDYDWLGDIDYINDERVLITQAYQEWGWGSGLVNHYVEVDVPTGEVVWRGSFTNDDYYTFRSERADICDMMPHAGWCEDVQARWAEVEAIFEGEDTGGTADTDGTAGTGG